MLFFGHITSFLSKEWTKHQCPSVCLVNSRVSSPSLQHPILSLLPHDRYKTLFPPILPLTPKESSPWWREKGRYTPHGPVGNRKWLIKNTRPSPEEAIGGKGHYGLYLRSWTPQCLKVRQKSPQPTGIRYSQTGCMGCEWWVVFYTSHSWHKVFLQGTVKLGRGV